MTTRILLALLMLTGSAYGQGAGSVAVVPTVAALTNRPPSALNPVVSVSGYRTNGDWGPARTMRYAPTSTNAIDNGCVFPTVTGTGRWEAADCDGPSVSVAYYGTYADNESNDSAAFAAAFDRAVQWRGESGGGVVYVPAGDYRVNWNMATPLANEDSITITGDGPGATALRPWTNTAPVLKLLGRNITVEKLMLKGDIITPQGVGLQLGDTNLATGAVVAANFRDLYILDFTTGLYIEGIDQAHFDGMVIQRCTNGLLASPRWYATSGTNAVMSKVKFTRSVWLGNYGDAITIRGGYAEQIEFDTCVIEQNYGKAVVIQQYNPIAGNPFRGFQFRNCFFEFNNNSAPAGDYYDIEFQPAVGTGANAIYSSMIEGCWFQTTRSSHTPIRIVNGGDYRIQNNDFISNNSYFISITNSPVIDLDVSFAKVIVEAGSSPQINWVNANRVELKGLTNAAPSLILTNTGRLLFSDGVNAPDLLVYRSAARVLAAEGTFRSIGTAASDQALLASVSGDAQGRFTALNSGRFEWGDGSAARDIFMERSGSSVMEMKGASWTFNRANATDWAIQTYSTGDTQYRLSLRADGRMEWSDGANPAGISLAPVSGNILNLLATYRIQRTNATDSAMLTGVLGESASRFEVDSAGRMSWGDGTGPRLHGSIERTAAGELTLKTNLVIPVGGGLTINGEKVTDWTGSGLSIVGGALTSAGAADGDKGDITVSGSGATWNIDADSVALGTDTTGNYVASVSGTANEVTASGSGEGAAVTVSLPATIDLGGKTSFELPNAAAPTVDAFGEIAGDDDAWAAGRGAVVAYDGTAATRLVGVLASDTPTTGQVPKWNTGGTITWEDDQTGAGGLSDGDKGDITVSGSGATWTIDADSVALGTDTTGNYVASVSGTANEVTASGSGEGAAVTVSLPATIDLGGKTSFEVPNGAAPTVDAFGEIAGDNDAWGASRGAPTFFDGTAATFLVGALASDTPTTGQVPKWNTGGTITWEDDQTGAGGLSDGDKGDITVSGSGATWTIDANSVALGTDTTGDYVATVTGTANEVSASGSGEGAAVTVSLPATVDLGGKTSFELPNGAAPTVDAFGEIAGDNDAWGAGRGAPVFYDGTAAVRLVGTLASDTPTAGQVPKWQTGGTITWEDDDSGAGGVADGDKGDITVSSSGSVWTIDANSVALGTDTTGDYVATVTGTANEVSASGSGEGAAVTVSLPATVDLGGKTSFELPNGAAPTVDAFGEIAGDNDAWGAGRGAPVFYDGTAAVRLVGVLASDTPTAGQVPKWQTGGTITWEDDTGGTGGGSTNYVNNLPYLPLKLTNDTASVGGIVWTTNANGDVKAQATNLPTVTNSPVTGLWQTLGSADVIVENTGTTTANVTFTNFSGVVNSLTQLGNVGSNYRLQLGMTFSENIGTNYLVLFDFNGADDADSSYALVGWSQDTARTTAGCEVSIVNSDGFVYSNDGFKIRIRIVNPNATAGGEGGNVVTTADNVLSGVNQFTNGLGQVFSVPPRVLGGRINGWTAPQMTPGTNATTQAQYKVLGDGIPSIEFDGATSEEISMVGLLSQDPDRGSFVTITFASDDTANTVCWQAQWQLLTLRGIDTNLLSSAATWTSNIPGTARVPTNITFSLNAPTGLVGSTNDFSKPYMLRITRLPGSDSSLSNAYLIGVDHRYGR